MSETCAFARTRIYRDPSTGATYHALRAPLDLAPAADDGFHVVREGDRLETIAAARLGDPALWWVLADVNDVADPFALVVGTTLRVPSAARVALEVLSG